jgi:hypothetical protein
MGDGRFETALIELARSIESMNPRQSFYVIFYSDAVYRMFHPDPAPDLVPATRPNKQRLLEWLSTVEMCTGGRLVDAMEAAETVSPQLVYMLSDGVISQVAVGQLTSLTDAGPIVHTIGMTVPNVEAARNLQAIASAHGGIFRAVGVNPLARQMARQRPVRKNRTRGMVWGVALPLP